MGLIRLLLLPVFAFAFYMLPTIIAIARDKQNAVAIGLVNFFLGWSIIAWVIALVWSLSADPVRAMYATPVNVSIPQAGIFCQHCGKFSHSDGRYCPHCGQTMQREHVRAAEVQLK